MPRYLFRKGVDISADGNDVIITTPYATRSNPNREILHLKDVKTPLKQILKRLSKAGIKTHEYFKVLRETEFRNEYIESDRQLEWLYKRGLLIQEIDGCDGIAMRLLPINPGLEQQPYPEADKEFKLSAFISIHPCIDGLDITTPLSPTKLRLQDHRLYPLIQKLASPCTTEDIRTFLPKDLRNQHKEVIALLLSSGTIGICNNNDNVEIDEEAITAGWNRQDLSFHRHTRGFFIDLHKEELPPKTIDRKSPPAKHKRIILSTVLLPKPSINNQNTDFYQIIRKRQTIRTYNSIPVTARELGYLLWYSMYTKEEITCDPALPRSYEGLLRPVASAGGLHSIELYLCIKRCIGISPGFYHYDSFDHTLGKMSDLNRPCESMLKMAVNTTCRAPQAASVSPGQGQQPDVLIIMATRYKRNASLHSETGLAYALILKDAGSIYQQLYLVATALGLAPCGLSFGSSELFEQVSGISGKVECSVGEFMIGNPK